MSHAGIGVNPTAGHLFDPYQCENVLIEQVTRQPVLQIKDFFMVLAIRVPMTRTCLYSRNNFNLLFATHLIWTADRIF